MSWLSWFSSTPKVIDDVMDKDNGLISQVGGWIGNMKLTDEEVLEANAKTVLLVQDYAIKTLDENSERSKSRREIANLIVKFYLLWLGVAFGLYKFDSEYSEFILRGLSGLAIGGAFTAVVLFHFGSHGLAKYKQSKKG
tara:strand:- start:39 stop:455 length:417 start_codon:yes stop_codon:yes gene_type:complete